MQSSAKGWEKNVEPPTNISDALRRTDQMSLGRSEPLEALTPSAPERSSSITPAGKRGATSEDAPALQESNYPTTGSLESKKTAMSRCFKLAVRQLLNTLLLHLGCMQFIDYSNVIFKNTIQYNSVQHNII